jgi:hypothetical protein
VAALTTKTRVIAAISRKSTLVSFDLAQRARAGLGGAIDIYCCPAKNADNVAPGREEFRIGLWRARGRNVECMY